MCRYSYVSGACANRRVESLHCIGEEDCEYSGMNVLCASGSHDDPVGSAQRWKRLYCDAHGRFLCDEGDGCRSCAERSPARDVKYRQGHLFEGPGESW